MSDRARADLRSALSACEEILAEMRAHVSRVVPLVPSGGQNGEASVRAPLLETLRMLWNERVIQDYERMLNNQVGAFTLFTQLAQL